MKIYLLSGFKEDVCYGGYYEVLYGCFSTKEKAEEIRKELEESPNWDVNETLSIDEHAIDEPMDNYFIVLGIYD